MAEQKCPHCGKHVIVNAAGLCTNCREPVAGAKTTVNPYQHSNPVTPYATKVAHQQSFGYQACRFALIAPLVGIFLGGLGNAFGRENAAGDATSMWVLLITTWLLVAMGAIFGLIGIVVSFQLRAWGTLLMGLTGFLLCSGLISLVALAAIS